MLGAGSTVAEDILALATFLGALGAFINSIRTNSKVKNVQGEIATKNGHTVGEAVDDLHDRIINGDGPSEG